MDFFQVTATIRPLPTGWRLHVRANQYLGSGQFHSDVGMFYFSGLGVNWITEAAFTKESSGKYHNLVLISNRAEPDDIPARGDYLGAVVSDQAAFGTVDQKNSYSYEWRNQVELWEDSDPTLPATASTEPWELETDPVAVAAYKGTQDYKSRAWYASYTITNWIPVGAAFLTRCNTLSAPLALFAARIRTGWSWTTSRKTTNRTFINGRPSWLPTSRKPSSPASPRMKFTLCAPPTSTARPPSPGCPC